MKRKLTHWNRKKEKKKSPRKGTRKKYGCRDPLVHTFRTRSHNIFTKCLQGKERKISRQN